MCMWDKAGGIPKKKKKKKTVDQISQHFKGNCVFTTPRLQLFLPEEQSDKTQKNQYFVS
jgi:hypothetical protein